MIVCALGGRRLSMQTVCSEVMKNKYSTDIGGQEKKEKENKSADTLVYALFVFMEWRKHLEVI